MNNLYEFYLYTRLVNDLIITVNDWSIPYDLEFAIVMKSYNEFLKSDEIRDLNKSFYDITYDYINNDETLYSELRDKNENTQTEF